MPAISTTRSWSRARRSSFPCTSPGALFEVGDGHAAQGDGEVDQTAIETSMRGRLQLIVRKGMTLAWPRAETPHALHQHGHRRGPHEGDPDRDSGDDRLPRRDAKAREARGVSAGQHRRRRGDYPAGRRQGRRPREDSPRASSSTGSKRRTAVPRRIYNAFRPFSSSALILGGRRANASQAIACLPSVSRLPRRRAGGAAGAGAVVEVVGRHHLDPARAFEGMAHLYRLRRAPGPRHLFARASASRPGTSPRTCRSGA